MRGLIRGIGRAVAGIGFGALAAAAAGGPPPCPAERILYVPVETVAETLGLRGETRAQYLDRRYGAGRWRLDETGSVVAIRAPQAGDAPFEVSIVEPPGRALERAEVIVEARLAYLGAGEGEPGEIYGHREAGSFLLAPGADAALRVPRSLFKERGALLVAVTLVGGGQDGGPPPVYVAAAPVEEAATACPCCLYVPDRFTAIRLNRPRNRAVEGP